jgi:amidase
MMLIGETAADIREAQITLQRKARYGSFEPATALLGLLGEEFSAVDFAMASRRLRRLHRQVGPFFEKYDLLLTPTLATPPVPIGTLMPHGLELFGIKSLVRLGAGALAKRAGAVDRIAENAWTFTPFTALFNVTGQPAASLPLHWNSDGVPIGCQLVAGFGNEEGLFQIAGQIERAQPWFDRRPPQRRQGDSNPT